MRGKKKRKRRKGREGGRERKNMLAQFSGRKRAARIDILALKPSLLKHLEIIQFRGTSPA